jgi:16S rRNA processing protein RimM
LSRSSTDLVSIGRVGKPHGLDGSFFVERASDDPERFEVGAVLHVGGETARVEASKRSGGRPVIRLDRAVARGAELTIPRDELPPTREGEYYAFQLVGLEVEEESGRALGRVAQVVPGVANDVLELDSGLALPLVEACVREVDLARGRIMIAAGFAVT